MSRHPFDLLMELQDHQIRLDCAALHLARDQYPTMHLPRYLDLLDGMAAAVAEQRPGLSAALRYQAMRSVLVDQYRLRGNEENYYAPENGHLHRVLDTGLGIPISLSIVWIEVARRLKWPVGGVALPGHFIVRFDDADSFILADPFYDGESLTLEDCERIVDDRFDGQVALRPRQLKTVSTRNIVVRVLRHLRNVYLAHNDLDSVAATLRRLVAAQPRNGRYLQELAAVCARRGDMRGACAHLKLCLERMPEGRNARLVRQNLKQVQAALVAQN